MQERRPDIAVLTVAGVRVVMLIVMMAAVMVSAGVLMTAAIPQQPGTEQIDCQAEHGDQERLVESYRNRGEQAHRALVPDQERDQGQDDGAREGGKLAELAGPEREPRVVGMRAREPVGERRDCQRGRVRGHVPAVGGECHRAVERAGDDLGDHRDRGERHHQPGPPFVPAVRSAEKHVAVLP